MIPSEAYTQALDSVSEELKRASDALDNCEFIGPCSEASNHSRLELMKGLIDLGRGENHA